MAWQKVIDLSLCALGDYVLARPHLLSLLPKKQFLEHLKVALEKRSIGIVGFCVAQKCNHKSHCSISKAPS